MSETIIKVEGVSKLYRLGQIGTGSLSHDITRLWHKMRGKEDPYLKIGEENIHTKRAVSEYIWALRDISFEVRQGKSFGILGNNGSGKSTLLKILSRITRPTTGGFKVKGRIASLLEVGTGFHPELTGRENIFMNGAILGMTRAEIKRKLDEIIAFSEIERYIDTPAKRYSSGMYVRLAFAVAAHLESEILIADEVLAVGDTEFQKKCLGKMKDITRSGRTVLFVSHNMAAVRSFCTEAVLLKTGSLVMSGTAEEVTKKYLLHGAENIHIRLFSPPLFISQGIKLHSITVYQPGKSFDEPIVTDAPVIIETELDVAELPSDKVYHINYLFKEEEGNVLFITSSEMNDTFSINSGRQKIKCSIPANFFNSGTFNITFQLMENGNTVILNEEDIVTILLMEGTKPGANWMNRSQGFLTPKFEWTNQFVN